ncbi:MAG TPA: DUF3108 domain-containing protein [Rhizomicrobium sp.]|nr:DUF3108 domain-containing protein [Rhizomicrobium sp.]
MRFGPAILGLTMLAMPLTGPAQAAGGATEDQGAGPQSALAMAMTIYAGGITIGKVDMDAKFIGDKYHVSSNLETSGVVNAFWQSQIQATSSGTLGSHKLEPDLYDSFYTGHQANHQEVSLSYEDGNPVRLYANPPYSTTGYEVKAEDKKSTFDPLSAVIFISSGVGATASDPCNVKAPVYDGRRRYNISLAKAKPVAVKTDNGLYNGPGFLCEVEYKQLSGFSPRVLRDANFPKIYAKVAVFPSGVPGRKFVVPLRVWANSQYGVVAAVTTSVKIDGNPLKGGG